MPNFDLIENTGTKPTTPDPLALRDVEEFQGPQAVSYSPEALSSIGEAEPPLHAQGGAYRIHPNELGEYSDADLMSYLMKSKELGMDPLLAGKMPPAEKGWGTVQKVPVKLMAGVAEQDRESHSNYLEAVDKRGQLIASYLQEHPAIASAYMEAFGNGDAETGYQIEDAITEELVKVYPDINKFEVTPEKKELYGQIPAEDIKSKEEAVVKGAQKMFSKEFEMLSKASKTPVAKAVGARSIPPPDKWVRTTEAVTAEIGKSYEEKLYQGMTSGLIGNLSAKPSDEKNYIPDELVNFYAAMVKSRSGDYGKHKHYNKIRQRLGEQLAGMGEGITSVKWKEGVRAAIPFGEQGLFPEEVWYDDTENEKKRREKVRTLMELADESVQPARMTGLIAGMVVSYGSAYSALTKAGLTSLIGSNARPVASMLATVPTEVAVDMAYNPHGYSLVLGSLLGEEENRVVSGIEAVALGTFFNLTVNAVNIIKGMKAKKVTNYLIGLDELEGHQRNVLRQLEKQAAKGDTAKPTAKQTAHTPAVDEGFMPLPEVSQETQARLLNMMEQTEASRLVELNKLEQALENANITGNKLLKKQLEANIAFLRNDRPTLPPNVRNKSHGTAREAMEESLSFEARMRVDKLRDEISLKEDPYAPPPTPTSKVQSADEVLDMLDDTLPEGYIMDLEGAAKATKEAEPFNIYGYTRKMVRDSLNTKDFTRLGVSLLGGKLSMDQTEQNKAGAFFAGMLLPAAAKGWGKATIHGYRGLSSALGYGLSPAQSTIGRISKPVWWGMVKNDFRIQTQRHDRHQRASAFFEHMNELVKKKVVTAEEKAAIYESLALRDRRDWALDEFKRIDKLLPKHQRGVTEPLFNEYEKVFRQMGDQAAEIGFEMGFIKDYFPRKILPKMYDEFLEEIGKRSPKNGVIRHAWEKWADKMGKNVDDLTDAEKAHIANDVINTRGWGVVNKAPSNSLKRQFEVVPDWAVKYYEPLDKTSMGYINTMTEALENHRFLGAGVTSRWLDQVVELAPGVVDTSPYKQLRLGPQRVAKSLHQTLGAKVAEMIGPNGKQLKPHQENLLIKRLRQFYVKPSGPPMWAFSKFMRDVSYSMTIGNFYSTMTQSTDVMLAASLNSRGMGGSVLSEALRRVTGRRMALKMEDLGFDSNSMKRMALEFEDEGFMRKWLQANLKATGFSAMDLIGKESLINGALKEFRSMAAADSTTTRFKALEDEFAEAMGGKHSSEFGEFVKSLRKPLDIAKQDPDVLAAVFSRLTQQHPVTKASMPLGYSLHPNGRLLYQLKSFTVKQLDMARMRVIDEIKKGANEYREGDVMRQLRGEKPESLRRMGRGMKDLIRYAGVFGLSHQGVNAVKDLMLGREVAIEDRAMSWAAQSLGLHRMYFHQFGDIATGEGYGDPLTKAAAMLGTFFSPVPIAIGLAHAYPDFTDWLSGDLQYENPENEKLKILGRRTPISDKWFRFTKGRLWRYIPGFGKDVFWSIGRGADIEAKRHHSTLPEGPTFKEERSPDRPTFEESRGEPR